MRGRQTRGESARRRIVRTLELGAEAYELERCLHECRKPLIAARAKADNLPRGHRHQAEFIERLPLKAEDIVCAWFQKNADFTGCGDAELAAERLFVEPDCSDRLVWRAILHAFVFRQCTSTVALWLEGAESAGTLSAPKEENLADREMRSEDVDLCLSVAEGRSASASGRLTPMLMAGAIAAASGESKSAQAWIASLEAHEDPAGKQLARAVDAVLRRSAPTSAPVRADFLPDAMVAEADHLPFVGIVKKVLPSGQIFVTIAALKVDGLFYEVAPAQAKLLFPETGDATAFPSVLQKEFEEGEIGLWTAVRRSPDRPTQYVVEKCLARPYLPVRVPHPSTEPDAVREWLQKAYEPSASQQPLFILADGLTVRLPSGQLDPRRVDFDMPLDGYRNVPWVELGGAGIAFAADLPAQVEKVDCAPPGTWVKRLLKKLKEAESAPLLSKSEIQAISELANTDQVEVAASLQRALDGLRNAADAKSLLSCATAELLSLPEVQEVVEAEKRAVAAAHAEDVLQAQQQLSEVGRKKQVLEGELDQLRAAIRQEGEQRKRQAKQQEADLVRRMRLAFDKASQEGAEALAQAAVVKALLMVGGAVDASPVRDATHFGRSAPALQGTPAPLAGHTLSSVREVRRAIEALSSAAGFSEMLLVAALAAARAAPVIGLAGARATAFIQVMADVLAAGLHCRASVAQDMFNIGDLMRSPAVAQQAGRAWAMTVGDYLAMAAAADMPAVIELRGANRAPLEALLPELADCRQGGPGVSWQDSAGVLRHCASASPVVLILTFADGKTVFPVPASLAAEIPLLSTDGWPREELQPGPSPDAARIAAEAWSLLADGGDSGALPAGASARSSMRAAAIALGLDSSTADAIERLAFAAGRSGHSEAAAEIRKAGGAVSEYAAGLESGSGAALQKLFDGDNKGG